MKLFPIVILHVFKHLVFECFEMNTNFFSFPFAKLRFKTIGKDYAMNEIVFFVKFELEFFHSAFV